MDPKNQPQFNPKIPISEVLKHEEDGYVPSAPKLGDVVNVIGNMYDSTKDLGATNSESRTTPIPPIPAPIISPINAPVTAPINPLLRNTRTYIIPKNTPPTNVTAAGTGTPPPASQVKIIKTYQSDAVEAVKMQQSSVAKIAMAEEDRRRERGENIGAGAKKKHGLLIAAIVLIVLGGAAIPTVQYILNLKTKEVSINTEKTIIPFESQETLTLDNATRDNFLDELGGLQTKSLGTSNIEYVKILEKIQDVDKKTITQKVDSYTFANLIGPNTPSALARSFDSDYMYGLEGPEPFILLKTSSYQQTFANMLKWETKMIVDLNPILNLSPNVLGRPFTDQVIINKDVRVITALDGTVIFLYGFLDNETLIITTNPQTFQDINSRYVTAHFVQ